MKINQGTKFGTLKKPMFSFFSLPADVRWGSVFFLSQKNTEPQRASAGRLQFLWCDYFLI